MSQVISNAGESTPVKVRTLKASSARTKGDMVYVDMDATGFVDLTPASDTIVHRAVVALHDIASGDYGLYVYEGPVSMTVPSGSFTAGNGLLVSSGAISDGGSIPTGGLLGEGQTDFGVITAVESGTVTTLTIHLHGNGFTTT